MFTTLRGRAGHPGRHQGTTFCESTLGLGDRTVRGPQSLHPSLCHRNPPALRNEEEPSAIT